MTKRRNFLKTIAGVILAPFGLLTARAQSTEQATRRWVCKVIYEGEYREAWVCVTKSKHKELLASLSRIISTLGKSNVSFALLRKACRENGILGFTLTPMTEMTDVIADLKTPNMNIPWAGMNNWLAKLDKRPGFVELLNGSKGAQNDKTT